MRIKDSACSPAGKYARSRLARRYLRPAGDDMPVTFFADVGADFERTRRGDASLGTAKVPRLSNLLLGFFCPFLRPGKMAEQGCASNDKPPGLRRLDLTDSPAGRERGGQDRDINRLRSFCVGT